VKKKKDISIKDQTYWEEYIKDPNDIFDKDKTTGKSKNEHIRFKFDLHGYSLLDANKKVKEIIISCSEKKYKEILLITGKGIHSNIEEDEYSSKDLSKLRYSIPNFIQSNTELLQRVNTISPAERKDGGEGAIVIKLKSLQDKL
tara:strand:+ start:578 stop:1009 length:432 start_codon:yes stop_codon:yes gene_type:complete